MGDEPEKPDALANTEAMAVSAISTALGFPIPPTVAKSAFKSVGALVHGLVDVPVAYLQSWALRVRTEAKARAEVTLNAVDVATKTIGADKDLAHRATMFLGERLLREQQSREAVAQMAMDDLKADPPKEDAPGEIDSDWLHMFGRHAETKTNEDVRAYFARVLAGEIRKPGSFAPETIEVLARLSPDVALLFQRFCNLTFTVGDDGPLLITAPFGEPGNNALAPVGFTYVNLCRLQDAGLLRTDFTSYILIQPLVFRRSTIGGHTLLFEPAPGKAVADLAKEQRVAVTFMTAAGAELRQIVHLTPNAVYVAKFVEWLGRLGLVLAKA